LQRLSARPVASGGGEPRPAGGDRRSRLPVHEAWLLALIEAEPDLILILILILIEIAARLLA
jgi:hypothetical protein